MADAAILVPIRFLFICGANQVRSPTAEHTARLMGHFADSCGVDPGAPKALTEERIKWANVVVCFDSSHLQALERFRGPAFEGKQVHCLDLPDTFRRYCHPDLVRECKLRILDIALAGYSSAATLPVFDLETVHTRIATPPGNTEETERPIPSPVVVPHIAPVSAPAHARARITTDRTVVSGIEHGTVTAYANKGCRCDNCLEAYRVYHWHRAYAKKHKIPIEEAKKIPVPPRTRPLPGLLPQGGNGVDVAPTSTAMPEEADRGAAARTIEPARNATVTVTAEINEHGTQRMYENIGCRCDVCKQWWEGYKERFFKSAPRRARKQKRRIDTGVVANSGDHPRTCACADCHEKRRVARWKYVQKWKHSLTTEQANALEPPPPRKRADCGSASMYRKGCRCIKCRTSYWVRKGGAHSGDPRWSVPHEEAEERALRGTNGAPGTEPAFFSHDKELRTFILRKSREVDMVDDLVQETYMRVWITAGRTIIRNMRAYLFTVARHVIWEYKTLKEKEGNVINIDTAYLLALVDDGLEPLTASAELESIAQQSVTKALVRMEPKLRRTVIAAEFQGEDLCKIGTERHLSLASARKYLVQGRMRLKSDLDAA